MMNPCPLTKTALIKTKKKEINNMPSDNSQVKVYKASQQLKKKAGTGKIDQDRVHRAENSIKNTDVDFFSFAKENLDDLANSIANAKAGENISKEQLLRDISAPLLQLKSSSSLFGFDLVGILAGIMFDFIQRIDHLDARAVKIISAHHTTLYAIISNKMEGDGGQHGRQLKSELIDVCKKYFKKI